MNDFEWQAVRDYLDSHTNTVAEIVSAARKGDMPDMVRAMRILLAPSCEACDTVEIEYRRK